MAAAPPFIVTAALEDSAFDWFEDLRRAHFPPERNKVPAHLTLFHQLPSEHETLVGETLKASCRTESGPLTMTVRGPWSLGRGVAFRLASPQLESLRGRLAQEFEPWLTAQDRAPFRPHITVQNKVEPDQAKALLEELQHDFQPFEIEAVGLLVWRYLGGPWEPVARLPFGETP